MTQPRPPVGGRYSLERPLLSSREKLHWLAIEIASGRLVVLAICEPGRVASLSAARGLTHRHLATLVDVVRDVPSGTFPEHVNLPAGAGVAVAEHLPGRTLRAVLADGPLHAAKAVAWVLRLADAVQALHAVGAVHGAISPRSVLANAEGRPIAPVLTQLVTPSIGAFCPPERLRGGAESASDDVWALYATLYAALTGRAPFAAPTRDGLLRAMASKPPSLATFGVDEPALQEIVSRGLAAERRMRMADLVELVAALDGWERDPKMLPPPAPPPRPAPRGLGDIVGGTAFGPAREDGVVIDDADMPDDQGKSGDFPDDELATVLLKLPAGFVPPAFARSTKKAAAAPAAVVTPGAAAEPAPNPVAPAVMKRPSINPFARKGSAVPLLAVAAVVVVVATYFALSGGKAETKPAATTVEAAPVAPRAPKKAAPPRAPEELRDECVVAHFAPDSFEKKLDFGFLCEDSDFREIAERLHGMVVASDPGDGGAAAPSSSVGSALPVDVVRAVGGRAADAGVAGSRLGWYELPVTAIIRKTCCPAAPPVVLHETPGSCEQLQSVVRLIADDSAKSIDLAPSARSFDKAVGCLYAQRIRHGYRYERTPTPANRALFQQFLGRSAIISARR
jgi:hypothetical protein